MPSVSRQTTDASEASQFSGVSEEDSYNFNEDSSEFAYDAEPFGPPVVKQSSDRVLEAADLVREQEESIVQISELFECPKTMASVMLRKFNWNTERLIERWMDNSEKVLKESGLSAAELKPTREGSGGVTCQVCYDTVSLAESSRCGQGHPFCNDCWSGYLTSQIGDGGALTIRCMQPKCPALIEPALVQALVDAPTFAKFGKFAQREYVDDNPYIKWCPAPDCTKAVKVGSLGKASVTCSCGFIFCFRCSREVHFPMTCAQLDQWEEKNRNDSETAKWIKANTKKCPKCFWPIEKNGGCNHMTCRRKECGHEFCWLCMQPWRGHQSCGAYKDDPSIAQSKAELERYLHYYERYAVHAQSQELEAKLRAQAEEKIQTFVAASDETVNSLAYIGEAAEALIKCRRVLKNTYPVAYFMKAGPEKNMLEYLQAGLELVTEELSGMLESEAKPDRVAVLSKAEDARRRLQHLVEGVEDGFTKQEQLEQKRQAGGGGGAGPSGTPMAPMPARQKSASKRVEDALLASLAEMGFADEEAARRALAATNNDLDLAAERLLTDTEALVVGLD